MHCFRPSSALRAGTQSVFVVRKIRHVMLHHSGIRDLSLALALALSLSFSLSLSVSLCLSFPPASSLHLSLVHFAYTALPPQKSALTPMLTIPCSRCSTFMLGFNIRRHRCLVFQRARKEEQGEDVVTQAKRVQSTSKTVTKLVQAQTKAQDTRS